MKKRYFNIAILLLVLAMSVVLFDACAPARVSEPAIPAHFTTYTSEGLFSISYPPDWELALSKEELFHAVVPNKAAAVTVTVGTTEEGKWKLEDLVEAVFQRAYIDDAEEYHELSRTKATVDEREAIILDFEAKYPVSTAAMRMLIMLLRDRDNELVWTVYCGVMPSKDFSYFEPDFHAIVRSLRILK